MTKNKNGIDLQGYGAMCEKINNLEDRFERFIDNEFKHVSSKVDKMLFIVIVALVGLAVNLVILLVK